MPSRTLPAAVVMFAGLIGLAAHGQSSAPALELGKRLEGNLDTAKTTPMAVLAKLTEKKRKDGKGSKGSKGEKSPKGERSDRLHRAGLAGPGNTGYAAVLSVKLKAGQAVNVSATVTGTDRRVSLLLLDPAEELIACSRLEPRAATVGVDEVASGGTYTVVVFSDLIGPYTVRVSDADDQSEEAILERIKELEQDLERLRAKLKEMRDKKK